MLLTDMFSHCGRIYTLHVALWTLQQLLRLVIFMVASQRNLSVSLKAAFRALVDDLLEMNGVDMIFYLVLGVPAVGAIRTLVIKLSRVFHMYVTFEYVLVIGPVVTVRTLYVLGVGVHSHHVTFQ